METDLDMIMVVDTTVRWVAGLGMTIDLMVDMLDVLLVPLVLQVNVELFQMSKF